MDDFEKRVLRRKRALFCKNIEVSSELLDEMKLCQLLTSEMVKHIEEEKKANAVRASHLLDALLCCHLDDAFHQLCGVLVEDYSWLVKELQSELKGEAGKLHIDADVAREASVIVHRKFGSNKRFSELDKKEIEDLIALKLQVSKEEWQTELELVRSQLSQAVQALKKKEAQTKQIDKQLEQFNLKNQERLASSAHGMVTTSELLQQSPDDSDSLSWLEYQIVQLFSLVHRALDTKECLEEEREKCLSLLNAPANSSLDVVIRTTLEELPKQATETVMDDLRTKTKQNQHLRNRVDELTKELDEYKVKTEQLEATMKAKDIKLQILNDRVGELILEARPIHPAEASEENKLADQDLESRTGHRPPSKSHTARSSPQKAKQGGRSTPTKY